MLARTFILFGIISATADAAASPIFHPHQGCGLECCSGDWTDALECTRSAHGPISVRHSSIDHSHHRCFLDTDEPNGCRCMCADMAFDGTESTLACAVGYEPLGGKCVLPTHCGSLEGDKTIKTFDSHADWLNGTYSERNGNELDTGDAYAAHCRPTTEGTLFSDHEKVRIVATVHDFAHITESTMHAPAFGHENNWRINGDCTMGSGGTSRWDWWNDPTHTSNCGDSYDWDGFGTGSEIQKRQHNIVLGSGTHELVIEDKWGDGWSGGYLTLAYENGTEFLSTQGKNFGRQGFAGNYECNDDNGNDNACYKMTITFTVEPTITNTATLVTDNLKCDWESPPINIDNTGFDQHSIGALDITTNFKEEGHKDSDDSYKVWITACTGLDGGGSCTEDLVHAVYDDTAATAVYHDSIENNGQVNIGEAHRSYKVRVETNAEGVGNKYFINSVSVKAAACTCPQYHHLSDGSCVANTCSCANGAAVANADCTVNGANQCSDCDWFYFKASTSCQRASTDEQYAQALDNEQISLKSHHGKYLVAEPNGDANWNRANVNTWETWSFEWNGGTSVSFKGHHGKYLVAETNGDANADRAVLGDWEKFTIDHISGNKITLKGAHGKYLVAEPNGDANANRDAAHGWETFKVFQQ